MTPQFNPAAYKNVQSERDPVSARPRLSGRVLTHRDRDRKQRFVKGVPALAATIVIAFFLTTSAIAQERQHAYSEYTYWFDGAFENGHAFSSTVGARNYQLESRYERLTYWKEPFAVRWVFEVVPVTLVGDRYTSTGRRAYSYGAGGSPIGAQVNFVHFHRVENFSPAAGASFTSTIGCLEPRSSTLLLNLAVVCSCSRLAAAPPLTLDTNITTFRTQIWEIKILDWTRTCCSSGCRCFGRESYS
jgi:hypothetical protein